MENKLLKKLLVKPGHRLTVLNAPETALASLGELTGIDLSTDAIPQTDVFLLFARNSSELTDQFAGILPVLNTNSIIWIIYPKKASGIPTDLEMMSHWDSLAAHGYRPVASAAFNEHWTALRMKPVEQVKLSDMRNDEIKKNKYSEYIDISNKTVRLPDDLKKAMQQEPASGQFFDSLSYTNRKEYVLWVLSARQEKTRLERVEKTVQKLLAGRKNPSEK